MATSIINNSLTGDNSYLYVNISLELARFNPLFKVKRPSIALVKSTLMSNPDSILFKTIIAYLALQDELEKNLRKLRQQKETVHTLLPFTSRTSSFGVDTLTIKNSSVEHIKKKNQQGTILSQDKEDPQKRLDVERLLTQIVRIEKQIVALKGKLDGLHVSTQNELHAIREQHIDESIFQLTTYLDEKIIQLNKHSYNLKAPKKQMVKHAAIRQTLNSLFCQHLLRGLTHDTPKHNTSHQDEDTSLLQPSQHPGKPETNEAIDNLFVLLLQQQIPHAPNNIKQEMRGMHLALKQQVSEAIERCNFQSNAILKKYRHRYQDISAQLVSHHDEIKQLTRTLKHMQQFNQIGHVSTPILQSKDNSPAPSLVASAPRPKPKSA